jgi:hypothetical protein
VTSRNVVFGEAVVLSNGESCRALEVQRNDDEEDNTPHSRNMCGEAAGLIFGGITSTGNSDATGVG